MVIQMLVLILKVYPVPNDKDERFGIQYFGIVNVFNNLKIAM